MVAEQCFSFPGNKKKEIGEWRKVHYDVNDTVRLVHHIANWLSWLDKNELNWNLGIMEESALIFQWNITLGSSNRSLTEKKCIEDLLMEQSALFLQGLNIS